MKISHMVAIVVAVIAIAIFASEASAYYNPSTGRFLSRDPGPESSARVGSATAEYADGMNLYQYAKSQPYAWTDPTGRYVNAVVEEPQAGEGVVWLEAGIVLWGPAEVQDQAGVHQRDDYWTFSADGNMATLNWGLLSRISGNIASGLFQLSEKNQYYVVCKPDATIRYRVRFRETVTSSKQNHFFNKPGDWHYVEIKRNPAVLGLLGEENAFSPSISTKNNRGGWGTWSYQTAFDQTGWWVAHEILHFAGLWDKYSWLTGQPNEEFRDAQGRSTNIMAGNPSWQLELWQVSTMLEDRLEESKGWKKGRDYEIQRIP